MKSHKRAFENASDDLWKFFLMTYCVEPESLNWSKKISLFGASLFPGPNFSQPPFSKLNNFPVFFIPWLQGTQASGQPVLVSSTAGDPSTDWELIELDDDQDDNSQAEASAGNESFVESAENRIIGNE